MGTAKKSRSAPTCSPANCGNSPCRAASGKDRAPRAWIAAGRAIHSSPINSSPGFDYADFEIGYRDALQREYPAFARDIAHLTRAEFAVSPAGARAASRCRPRARRRAQSSRLRKPIAFAESDIAAQTVAPGVTLQELIGQKSPLASTPR